MAKLDNSYLCNTVFIDTNNRLVQALVRPIFGAVIITGVFCMTHLLGLCFVNGYE